MRYPPTSTITRAHLAVEFVFIGRPDHRLVAGLYGFQDLAEPLVFLFSCPPALDDVVQMCGDDGLFGPVPVGKDIRFRGQVVAARHASFQSRAISCTWPASLGFANGPGDGCRSVSGSWHASMPRPRNSDAGRANNASAARLNTITLPCRSTPNTLQSCRGRFRETRHRHCGASLRPSSGAASAIFHAAA